MRWIREHKLVSFLTLLIVLAAGFIIFAVATGGEEDPAAGISGTVFGKISQPFASAGKKISGGVSGIFSYKKIKAENDALRKENEQLKQQVAGLTIDSDERSQIKALKKALKYKGKGDTTELVSADIISTDGTNWMNIFTINIGTERGVKSGCVVVGGGGLVGTVKNAGRKWSKVVALTDQNVSLSFAVKNNKRIIGIINSSDGSLLKGFTLDSEATVTEGDKLVTSGLGSYPSGIPIGSITRVRYDSNEQLQNVTVRPAVDFKALRKVSVLL